MTRVTRVMTTRQQASGSRDMCPRRGRWSRHVGAGSGFGPDARPPRTWDVSSTLVTTAEPTETSAVPPSLTARHPRVPADRLLAELAPPRHFAHESFATYRPDPAHASQQRALDRLREVADALRALDRTDPFVERLAGWLAAPERSVRPARRLGVPRGQ